MRVIVLLFSFIFFFNGWATPKEIIIVRYADKWGFKHHGPTLDPTGYARSVNFAFYFLNKFGRPDYVITTSPSNRHKYSASIRELQTVAPLINILAINDRAAEGFPILYPYRPPQYSALAKWLLKSSRFNNKLVLICWDHFTIPALANRLGVRQKLPRWSKEDFDSVYIIKYHKSGEFSSFKLLHHQYPTKNIQNWTVVQKALAKAEK